jgi:stage III sporulation protein AD
MDRFIQASALVLLTVIVCLILSKQEKEIGLLLSVLVCCMLGVLAISYLEPMMELIKNLRITAQLDGELLEILMKAVGVGFLAEIAGMVCTDAGNGTLGKVLQFLGSAVILWMSIPLFQRLLELVASILGEI